MYIVMFYNPNYFSLTMSQFSKLWYSMQLAWMEICTFDILDRIRYDEKCNFPPPYWCKALTANSALFGVFLFIKYPLIILEVLEKTMKFSSKWKTVNKQISVSTSFLERLTKIRNSILDRKCATLSRYILQIQSVNIW